MIISGQCPGEGGEKCNKILLKNNIYSDQGPVPDVGITLPRGGNSRKHIFIQIIKNTFICFDPNLTASEEKSVSKESESAKGWCSMSNMDLSW